MFLPIVALHYIAWLYEVMAVFCSVYGMRGANSGKSMSKAMTLESGRDTSKERDAACFLFATHVLFIYKGWEKGLLGANKGNHNKLKHLNICSIIKLE